MAAVNLEELPRAELEAVARGLRADIVEQAREVARGYERSLLDCEPPDAQMVRATSLLRAEVVSLEAVEELLAGKGRT